VFLGSFAFFIFFLVAPHLTKRPTGRARKVLLALQLFCFAYWQIVFWLYISRRPSKPWERPKLIEPLAVPESSDPEGSLFMIYGPITLIFAAFIIIELLLQYRNARLKMRADD
jgi:hypothetical protein